MEKVNNNKSNGKSRINAFISPRNYKAIDEIMKNNRLGTMKLSKGLVLDIAIANLVHALDVGESIESLSIQFLEGSDDL